MVEFKAYWRAIAGETKSRAQARHALLVARLERAEAESEGLDLLRKCNSNALCRRELCPICTRWFRRELLRAFLNAGLDEGVFTRISVILAGQAIRPGEFESGWLHRLIGMVSKQIERSPLNSVLVFGGIDISLNTLTNNDPWWIPHAYLLLNQSRSIELEGIIRRTFRLSVDARRPIDVREVAPQSLLACVTYAYKNGFYRRSSYIEPDRFKSDGSPRRNTRAQSLSPASEVELARTLAEYSVGSRLILRNVRRVTPPTSDHVELRLMRPIMRS